MLKISNKTTGGCALVMTAGVLASCLPAWAGTWSFQVVADGKTTIQHPGVPNATPQNWDPTDGDDWGQRVGILYPDFSYIGKTLSIKADGTLTVEAVFKPSFPTQPLPDSVIVLIKTQAVARGSKRGAGTSTFAASSVSVPEGTVRDVPLTNPNEFQKEARGAQLLKLSTKGATRLANGWYKVTREIGRASADSQATIGTTPGQPWDADEPNSPDTSDYHLYLWAQVYGNAQEDTRAFFLSSSIEPSYKKGTSLPSDLNKLSPNTPANTNDGKGPWGVLCERGADGTMEVHSAAQWDSQWRGRLNIYALAQGFTPPSYTWTLSGGYVFNPAPTTYDWGLAGGIQQSIQLRGDGLGNGMTKASTFTAKTDGDLTASATYKVNWHLPLESINPNGPDETTYAYDDGASDWVPMNTPITVTTRPASVGWSIAGGGAGLAGAGAAVFFPTPPGALAGLALTAAGFAITELAPQDITFTRPFGYDDYSDAVRRQYAINTGAASRTENHWRVAPSHRASLAYPALTDSAHVANDPYYTANSGVITGKIIISRSKTTKSWRADQYDSNGYSGQTDYTTYSDGAPIYTSLVNIGGAS